MFIDATGELSGVGPVTLHIDETAICGEQGLDGITDVTGTYTADNGDELRFTGTGSTMSFDGDTATASYTATDQFDGGTGASPDATGQESVTFSHNFTDMVLTVVVDGELTTTD